MSESTVLGAVALVMGAVSGITVVRTGWPVPEPYTSGIGMLVYVEPNSRRGALLTYLAGGQGTRQLDYTIVLRLILGPPNMDEAAAQAAAAPFPARVRKAVYADLTFGGACLTSSLPAAMDNLTTYQRDQAHPTLAWRLAVTEFEVVSA